MSDIFERISIIAENIHNAIDDYVKDPEKREELSNKAHDIQQADDPDQKRFMEKNVHKISGHGKEYQKHNGPYTADYPNTGVYSGMDTDKTVDHLMNIAKSKAEDRYYKRRAKNRRFEKKMDKNEALQEHLYRLIESFSNLFEVEGLGNPAVDVPPSQNKIKKDRKTKDGKVELVSVEDELFPYDGNKKEQYRQKILDTINNMIQGTATLEDLLQIVRQKKAPLKEAMELMEAIINEVSNKTVENALDQSDHNAVMSIFKMGGTTFHKYKKLKDIADKRAERHGEKIEVNDDGETRKHTHVKADEALEEAIEVLESIIQESSHKRKYGSTNATDGDTVGHTGTKYFKDGSKMHPHRVTKSNGHNGVDYAPRGTEYFDFDDKKVLQDAIKNGKDQPVGDDFKKIQKDLTNPATKNDMYGKNMKWVANTLANRGKDYASTVANTPKDTFTYTQGRLDKNKVKTDPTVLGRVEKTKKRIKSKQEASEALEEALEIVQSLVEATPFETKRRIADEFKDKINDMHNKAVEDVDKNSKEWKSTHDNIHKKGGGTVVFAGDKITDFSEDPEVRKEQEKFNEITDKGKKLSAKEHKIHHLRNLVDYYKTPDKASEALEEALAIINEVSKEFLKDKDDKAKVKVLKAIIRHGETMTPENPEGDPELLKIRQDSIDRLKKYREKCKDYLEKKEKRNEK